MEIPNKWNLLFDGIMVADFMSNKADRKEQAMEDERKQRRAGRFLGQTKQRPVRHRWPGRWQTVIVLLALDGLLLYMIVHCLIEPVYGAVLVAVVSVYLGYQL